MIYPCSLHGIQDGQFSECFVGAGHFLKISCAHPGGTLVRILDK